MIDSTGYRFSISASFGHNGTLGYRMSDFLFSLTLLENFPLSRLGIQGVVVGEGDSYEDALNDVRSAIAFHIETFGESVLEAD